MNEVHFPVDLGCNPIGESSVYEGETFFVRRYYFLNKDLNGHSALLRQVGRVREGLRSQDLEPQVEVEATVGLPSEVFIG